MAVVYPDGRPPLGASYDPATRATTFALWAPDAESVEVCLLSSEEHSAVQGGRIPLPHCVHGVWFETVPDVEPGREYGFRVHGPWIPERGLRFNSSKLLIDPYARAITGSLVVDDAIFGYDVIRRDDTVRDLRDSAPYVPRSVVTAALEPLDSPRPRIPWDRTVLYELHVRGFTMRHPDVPPSLRGTYAGLAHPAVLSYLSSLGVTTVELMPVHHFVTETWLASRGASNYWGYNTLGFFAPHAAYSSSGTRGEQVEEFRSMVRAFHEAGLEVVLDVVYNHTCEQGEFGPTLSFRGIHNRGYYRLFDGGRRYIDITGTANTLDLRRPQVIAMVMDSLRYWVTEMGVDGFRFDLAPVLARTGAHGGEDLDAAGPLLTAIGQDPVLSQAKLIAEPWDIGPNGFWLGGFPAPWAEWNGHFRDDVRDFWRGASSGASALGSRLAGSTDVFPPERGPYASVNFVTCHDGFTARDVVSYDEKVNADGNNDNRSADHGAEGETSDPAIIALRQQQVRNLLATTVFSVGVPMLLAGDELGRTQRGNNNAYTQDNEISWIDWSTSGSGWDATPLVREVLRLRREHASLRPDRFLSPDDVRWFRPDGGAMDDAGWHNGSLRTLGMLRDGLLLWFNAADEPVEAVVPDGPWKVVLDTASAAHLGERLRLPERSIVVLRRV